ncbi:type I-E CRISPR-associated protein Cas5/CasD [Paracoccus yeei]|uniref:type I-E CRISPR-associated protein Cas5/CasD n=1 Tax=Paracoccus yeei TaxID=147645 RepID=UPI00174B884D|nr:type I-E CRISPR-associated protein Cas5/CasD [Paracoccus yeei]
MHAWLKLDLAGPLMAFGGVAIDQVGPVRDFPAASMLTGLFANALGLEWRDRQAHQDIQDRLVFAAAIMREGVVITDSQNAQLEKTDRGWTTWGEPEGRDGASYGAPHRRRRDYLADAHVVVVARLVPGAPTTEHIRQALLRPARPLFIGRKPCLPTRPILAGTVNAATAHDALIAALPDACGLRACWPADEGPAGHRGQDLPDLRNWISGFHAGTRRVAEGRLP